MTGSKASTKGSMRVEAFIIHLSRATQRRPQVEKLRRDLPIPSHIIDGVDGLLLTTEEMAAVYSSRLQSPRYPFKLRNTEIGCFLSHRRAWQAIVDSGADAGLVVEDDVDLYPSGFPAVFEFVTGAVGPADYVRFPCRQHGDEGKVVATSAQCKLIQSTYVGLGMQMQLVGKNAALALLEKTQQFDRPVDTTIQLDRIAGIRVLAARPVCIKQISGELGGSVVQKRDRTLGKTVKREVRRALYRLKVWCLHWRKRNRTDG